MASNLANPTQMTNISSLSETYFNNNTSVDVHYNSMKYWNQRRSMEISSLLSTVNSCKHNKASDSMV